MRPHVPTKTSSRSGSRYRFATNRAVTPRLPSAISHVRTRRELAAAFEGNPVFQLTPGARKPRTDSTHFSRGPLPREPEPRVPVLVRAIISGPKTDYTDLPPMQGWPRQHLPVAEQPLRSINSPCADPALEHAPSRFLYPTRRPSGDRPRDCALPDARANRPAHPSSTDALSAPQSNPSARNHVGGTLDPVRHVSNYQSVLGFHPVPPAGRNSYRKMNPEGEICSDSDGAE